MHSVEAKPHLESVVDSLLADVAIRIQLSKTNFDKAVSRYKAVSEWIEHDTSSLKDRVERFYPQGSMAIGATIASRLRTDEFDIDVAAQLGLAVSVSPKTALDVLFEAIKGEPGSRYFSMVERNTRCVTVNYDDRMHLDVTPTLRRQGTPPRESWIFSQRPETPNDPGERLIANPYGFAEWFKDKTPPDYEFSKIFEGRASQYESLLLKSADSEPVPPQQPPFQKSRAVVVLQLLKRWRNVQYDTRDGRRPPSIVIAKLVADASDGDRSLSQELVHQARHMLSVVKGQHDRRRLIHMANPKCQEDILTDRWPESWVDQGVFVNDLRGLIQNLERLSGEIVLKEIQEIMIDLFGESPAREIITVFARDYGQEIRRGRSNHSTDTGKLVTPAYEPTSTSKPSSVVRSTQKNTFFGY